MGTGHTCAGMNTSAGVSGLNSSLYYWTPRAPHVAIPFCHGASYCQCALTDQPFKLTHN